MRKQISVAFNFGDSVRLKTEPDMKRIVTGYILRQSGRPMYELAWNVESTWHHEVEIENFSDNSKKVHGFGK